MKFLCWIGIHRWERMGFDPTCLEAKLQYTCERCSLLKEYLFK